MARFERNERSKQEIADLLTDLIMYTVYDATSILSFCVFLISRKVCMLTVINIIRTPGHLLNNNLPTNNVIKLTGYTCR